MFAIIKRFVKTVLKDCGFEFVKINTSPVVFFEIDSEFNDLYKIAQGKTQSQKTDNLLRRQRQHTLMQLLKQAPVATGKGDVAECGCWRGLSAYQIAYALRERTFHNKFFIFDSFEGLSKFGNEDLKNNVILDEEKRRKEFACALDIVKDNLKEFDFIEYKKGWIPERFSEVKDLSFSFVHIDVDLYQPVRESLEFFYPRMMGGGVIALDDYGYLCFPGAKSAVDKFMAGKPDMFIHLPSGEAFIIKKDAP